MKGLKPNFIFKLLFLVILSLFLAFLSFPKNANAVTCGTHKCQDVGRCAGCSLNTGYGCNDIGGELTCDAGSWIHNSPSCGPTCGTPVPGTTACGATDCSPNPCPDGGSCTGTKPNPPGTGCSCSSGGGGGGGSTQPALPPVRIGDSKVCLGLGATCVIGSTDPNGKKCCQNFTCVANTQANIGPQGIGYHCAALSAPTPAFKCSGTSCSTAVGDIPINAAGFVQKLFAVILSISGGIAILLIIISGYKFMVSRGNPEQIQGAREQLTAAIVGLLFIILSLVILQVIGVDILKLPGFTP